MTGIRLKKNFSKKIVMVGFGSVGQGVLPLLDRYFDVANQVLIINPTLEEKVISDLYKASYLQQALTAENYEAVLKSILTQGDFLLNLSVDVCSYAIIQLCQEIGCLYLDTCIEPWAGGYIDSDKTPAQRSNYALREDVLSLRQNQKQNSSTAVITHGANPGLVSHFVKKAILTLAEDINIPVPSIPKERCQWAELACQLNIKSIHIAERDWQISKEVKKKGEFVNTWSIDGFYGEGCQPAELGWGSHEKQLPIGAHHHKDGCKAGIYLERPGLSTSVKTWTPMGGPIKGYLITHGESISIADYLTVSCNKTHNILYRPTVHYSYHPCNDAILSLHELLGNGLELQEKKRLLRDQIVEGADELGVLLMGHKKGAYWYGSQLTVHEARALVPYNSATTLQITAAVLAGMIWAIENPFCGIVEPEELDFQRILEIALPYLGNVVGVYTDWTPLKNHHRLFEEKLDETDPWQFSNFLIG